ncbi:MAG: hypothetical protein ABEH81_15150 [Halopenitus sp.]
MPEDRSLDDFVGASASDDDDVADEASDEVADTSDESPDESAEEVAEEATDEVADEPTDEPSDVAVEPPSITATWDTDGIACERCDTEVERRWKCDGDYVCADCKDW